MKTNKNETKKNNKNKNLPATYQNIQFYRV